MFLCLLCIYGKNDPFVFFFFFIFNSFKFCFFYLILLFFFLFFGMIGSSYFTLEEFNLSSK